MGQGLASLPTSWLYLHNRQGRKGTKMTNQQERRDVKRAKELAAEIDQLFARLPRYAQDDATRVWEQWFGFAYAVGQGWVSALTADGIEQLETLRNVLRDVHTYGVPLVNNVREGDTLAITDFTTRERVTCTVVKVHEDKARAVVVRYANGETGYAGLLWPDWQRVRLVVTGRSGAPMAIREVTA